jgi:paraquat-inducible protein B
MTDARPVAVGSFVLGGLALVVAAIVFFGGRHAFVKRLPVVVVFQNSIAGLEVGAPVTFRGVRVGRVAGMRLHIDVLHHVSWIPVHLDLNLGQVTWTEGSVGTREDLQTAVAAGLRAQLVSQGLVSGQLGVDLDYRPGTPARMAGEHEDAVEIPTIPSDLQNLKDEIQHLDLPAIGVQAQRTLASLQRTLDDFDGKFGPLADNLQKSLLASTAAIQTVQTGATRAAADIDRLAVASRSEIVANGGDLDRLLRSAQRTTEDADTLVAALNGMTAERGDLQAALRDLSASASSMRRLTHDLERNPVGTLMRKGQR